MFRVEIKAHSVDTRGNENLTVSATFPRIILAEVNTHRMLSKNTSSSRAIPFNKMVESVEQNPFVPIAWQENHKGMQGTKYLDETEAAFAKITWLDARRRAVNEAYKLNKVDNVTKQLANRLLEPFMWTTMLITGPVEGGWDNFFNLRCPQYKFPSLPNKTFKSKKEVLNENRFAASLSDLEWLQSNKGQGEIHIMKIAEMIYDALQESTPILKQEGEWHIPYFNDYHLPNIDYLVPVEDLVKISTSMAARESYTVVGESIDVTFRKHIELYDKLVAYDPPHSSPMEHCSKCMDEKTYFSSIRGNINIRVQDDTLHNYKALEEKYGDEMYKEENFNSLPLIEGKLIHEQFYKNEDFPKESFGWCRNLKGFIPLRHIIETNNKK